jgi:hypothetical protein
MTQPDLLKRLEAILTEGARTHLFGTIEIVMHDGRPSVLRTLRTERLDTGDNPRHANQTSR